MVVISRIALALAVAALVLLPGGPLPTASAVGPENIDPKADGSQYAYAENVGWINAEPSGDGGPGVVVTTADLRGYMWGENIGWISMSCRNTDSCATVSYGVSNDGLGNLAGYAWAENVGWINFSCTNNGTCGTTANYGVTIDSVTGEFSGYAWGENIGWISFSCTNTSSCGTVDYGVRTAGAAPPVGGVAELPEVAAAPLDAEQPSGPNTAVLAAVAGAVLAAGTVALSGAAWYARRRRA